MSDAIEASDLDTSSVTRLGDFCKFLATKFIVKEAQLIDNFLGYFEKPHSYAKTALATFWATFGEKIGLLFTPSSGYTELRRRVSGNRSRCPTNHFCK